MARARRVLAMAVILLVLGLAVSLVIGVPHAHAQGPPQPPSVQGVTPNTGIQGQTLNVTITGQYFTPATGVTFGPPSGITVNGSITVVDDAHITANITIGSSAPIDSYDVTVSAPLPYGNGTLTDGFTVVVPSPVVTSVSPDFGYGGQTLIIDVTGLYLSNPLAVSFGDGITTNGITPTSDPDHHLLANITISEYATPGPRDVIVTTPGGSNPSNGLFTVKVPPPNISSLNPNLVYRGQTDVVQIYGEYFTGVTSVNFGSGVKVVFAGAMSDTWIMAKVSVASNATPGFRDVSVTTPWGSDILSNGFSVPEGDPMIKILSPNTGEEKWEIGSEQTITWTSSPGLEDNPVKIEYSLNGGSSWRTAISRTANDGITTWKVADHGSTNRALIRIRTILYPQVSDVSDMLFTISLPAITVLTPNGSFGEGQSFQAGEKWELGTEQIITWTSSPSISYRSKVKIQISYDGGKKWKTIKSSTENDGTYTWKKVKGKPSDQAIIKITSRSNKKVWDTSDAFFRIISPTIEVVSPNGGESWTVGTYQTINWKSSPGLTGKVKIQISYDGGKKWKTIKSSTKNDGTEKWKVKGNPTYQAFIKVISKSDKKIYDFSDAGFSIRDN